MHGVIPVVANLRMRRNAERYTSSIPLQSETTLYYPIITFQRYLAMPLFAIYNESQSRVSKKAPTQRRFRLSVPFPRIYHLVWFVITENRKFWESLLRKDRYKASPNGITPSSGAAITRSRGDERVLLKHTDGETIGLQTYRFGAEYPTATAAPAAGIADSRSSSSSSRVVVVVVVVVVVAVVVAIVRKNV
uniref:Uncharacterized protein n=1 Tax=Vespula pensylvanica TaxID=30213 RepID=A0A834PDE2_VESPE|nr:hypothetical protein H0235_000060 [Vespula pensylvanica]